MDIQAKVTSKGQVTIPKSVREALGLQQGDGLLFRVHDTRAVIAKTPDFLDLAGSVPAPKGRRGSQWEEVRRHTRKQRAERQRPY